MKVCIVIKIGDIPIPTMKSLGKSQSSTIPRVKNNTNELMEIIQKKSKGKMFYIMLSMVRNMKTYLVVTLSKRCGRNWNLPMKELIKSKKPSSACYYMNLMSLK